MDDLVERLLKKDAWTNQRPYWHHRNPDGPEAAARIHALETALAEARRQALEEAAKVAEELEVGGKTSTMEWANCMVHARDIAQALRALASDALLDRQGKEGDDLPSAIDVAFTVGEEAHKRVGVTPLMREVMALCKQHGHPPSCCCAECAKDWMGDD